MQIGRTYNFCVYSEKGSWWFRIFGKGLYYKNTKLHMKTFSERYGYRKFIELGNWLIGVCPKTKQLGN